MITGSYLSIITLKINGLNAPTKQIGQMDTKPKSLYMLSIRDPPQTQGRSWKKIFHANRDQNKVGIAIFLTDLKKKILISSGFMPRSGIAVSYGGFILSFLRNLQGLKRQRYPIVHCSTIYNSQNMEATQVSINR